MTIAELGEATSEAGGSGETEPRRNFDVAALLVAKAAAGLTVSVCIPARKEAATIAEVVSAIMMHLVERDGLVDEVIVADDGAAIPGSPGTRRMAGARSG